MRLCLFGVMNIVLCDKTLVYAWQCSQVTTQRDSELTQCPEVTETRCPECCVSLSDGDFWSPAPDHELSDTSSCVQSQHSQDQSWAKLVGRDLHYKGPISQRPGSLYLIPRHPQHYIVIFSAAHLFVLLSISALSLSLWTLKIRARRTETE